MNKQLLATSFCLSLLATNTVAQEDFSFEVDLVNRAVDRECTRYAVMLNDTLISCHNEDKEAIQQMINEWATTKQDGYWVDPPRIELEAFGNFPTPTEVIVEVPVEVIVEVPVVEYVEVEKIVEKIVEVEVEKIVYVEVPTGSDTIEIPGAADWVPTPDWGTVRRFMVLNDTWAVASSNLWLYAFLIDTAAGPGIVINRPAGWYRNAPALAETTALTDEQVVELIASVVNGL